jgi:hypothetical protein
MITHLAGLPAGTAPVARGGMGRTMAQLRNAGEQLTQTWNGNKNSWLFILAPFAGLMLFTLHFMLCRNSTKVWSKASTRIKPRRGYSRSTMTYTTIARVPAKTSLCSQTRDLAPAMP